MSSAKRDVDVYDGSRHVERLTQRPVRLMPDNHAGVVYGGEVYPLRSGDRIYLADAAIKKTLCPTFVVASDSVPYAPSAESAPAGTSRAIVLDRWHVESNRFGHYLVFDASPATARQVAAEMDRVGLGVRRWDESVREANNGQLYDWFIRLKFDGSRDECLKRIEAALSSRRDDAGVPEPGTSERDDPRLTILQLQVENLELQTKAVLQSTTAKVELKRLTDQLAVATNGTRRLNAQLAELRRKSRLERDRSRRQVRDLEHRLAARHVSSAVAIEHEERLQQVRDAKDEAEQQYFDAQECAEQWESRAHELESLIETVRAETVAAKEEAHHYRERLERAESELSETRQERRERRRVTGAAGGPPKGSVEAFLSRLLPRTDLDVDSVETLLSWPNLAVALELLRQIDLDEAPRRTKPVVSRPGWWEVPKVNTGRSGKESAGRIYYAPTKDKRVYVVLHDKEDGKEQKRFIDRLPDEP